MVNLTQKCPDPFYLALPPLQELREAVLLPMRLPHLFTGLRRPQVNVLLHGLPGTGGCCAACGAAKRLAA